MLYSQKEAIRFDHPVKEFNFTPDEIHELWSNLFEDNPAGSNSGSKGSCQAIVPLIDNERRQKRMVSNRESARRSRLRKKRHLENLTVQTDRLKVKNQELKSELNSALNRGLMVRRQNERLWSEFVALNNRLSDLYRICVPMHEIKNNNSSMQKISFNYYSHKVDQNFTYYDTQ